MERLQLTDRSFPDDILQDIHKVETILLEYGAEKVILYGSFARGDYHINSDIDICVEGLPNKNYFRAYAECLMKIHRPVSLLDFGSIYGYLKERILEEGRIIAMRSDMLREEIEFGLENLEKIRENIAVFYEHFG